MLGFVPIQYIDSSAGILYAFRLRQCCLQSRTTSSSWSMLLEEEVESVLPFDALVPTSLHTNLAVDASPSDLMGWLLLLICRKLDPSAFVVVPDRRRKCSEVLLLRIQAFGLAIVFKNNLHTYKNIIVISELVHRHLGALFSISLEIKS